MSACYECSLCHKQYSDLDPAMMCCSEDKAAMSGLSGQALMSMSQAIRMEERAAIVAWLRETSDIFHDEISVSRKRDTSELLHHAQSCSRAAKAIEAGEHLK